MFLLGHTKDDIVNNKGTRCTYFQLIGNKCVKGDADDNLQVSQSVSGSGSIPEKLHTP